MVTITLELDKEIEAEARSRGLLSGQKIAQMIEDEVREQKRDEAIRRTRKILAQLDELEPHMTEEEIAEELRKPSVKS